MKIIPKVVVEMKECNLCKTPIRVEKSAGSRVAFDIASGEEHDCWEMLPDDAHPLVLEDDDD